MSQNTRMILLTISLVLILPGFTASPVMAQLETKLIALDTTGGDEFGYTVALSADGATALVGARWDDDGGSDAGAAYVFTWDGMAWSEQAKLTASDAAAGDQFGYAVALSGDGTIALVGSPVDDDGGNSAGGAYVFTWDGMAWSEQAKLTASDAAAYDYFGWSVTLSRDGTTALVGAMWDDDGGSDAGAAYVFTWDGTVWSEQAKLTASDAAADDRFGQTVAISGDGTTALVGSPFDADAGSSSGAAYVFTWDGMAWSEQAKLTAPDATAGDEFGWAVALSGDGNTALVSSPLDADAGGGTGAAYVFTWDRTGWSEQVKLTASDATGGDLFGCAVALSGDGTTALVGAYWDDDGGSDSGAAYVFTSDGMAWSEQAKLTASDATAYDYFGWSVTLSRNGTTALVGARWDDDGGSNAGAAYVFMFDITPPTLSTRTVTYEEGTTGHVLRWALEDLHPGTYEIYNNSILVRPSASWTIGEPIDCPIDGLVVGIYNFTLVVYDEFGNRVLDTVWVEVTPGTPVPPITTTVTITAPPEISTVTVTTCPTTTTGVSLFSNALWILPLALLTGGGILLRRRRT